MTIFMKVTLTKVIHLKYKELISDFFTSTELIPKRRLNKWIKRPGFGIRDNVHTTSVLRGMWLGGGVEKYNK